MPEIIVTEDGSHSLKMDGEKENYHSTHGALTESLHVFIHHGFNEIIKKHKQARILEVGFGTGLNCLLTLAESIKAKIRAEYHALEPYPVSFELAEKLNYPELIDPNLRKAFETIHSDNELHTRLSDDFTFVKYTQGLHEFRSDEKFDLVYYDAFAPAIVPPLWDLEAFRHVYELMSDDSILVTYCAKGAVKRALREAGFVFESLPGPPGKREMTRGRKLPVN